MSARERCRLAVFASGAGSNLRAILAHAERNPDWPGQVVLVVSDKPGCGATDIAAAAGVPVFAARVRDFADKAAFEQAVLNQLRVYQVEGIALAGYMRLVGPVLLQAYGGRIVNLHPSLLPAFPGRTAVQDALAAGVRETGVTVHWVDEGLDTGPVIAQWRVPVFADDDVDRLWARLHRIEHLLYPVVLGELARQWKQHTADAGTAADG